MNIFVGNLSFDSNNSDVKKLFEGFGNVSSAVIVMRKEKKAPKSRGFGFVEMPDEQQALCAIAALNGKEFMGRALDVNPARPKAETKAVTELRQKRHPRATVETKQHHSEEREEKKTWFSPVFNKPGTYRGGRHKNKGQAKPWQKSPGEHKPWEKTEGQAGPRPQKPRFKGRRKPGGHLKKFS